MKVLVLMGSPRKGGNTAALLAPFCEELRSAGTETETVWLYDRDIRPCLACRRCQEDWTAFGCGQQDDVQELFDKVLESDCVVLATPIYAWYCTPPMKALMDRLIYAGCKYYGREKQRSAFWMKQIATLTTCGYRPENGADLWEEGLKRWCAHGEMDYLGMFCRRDTGKWEEFMDEKVEFDVRDFAHALYIMVGHSL